MKIKAKQLKELLLFGESSLKNKPRKTRRRKHQVKHQLYADKLGLVDLGERVLYTQLMYIIKEREERVGGGCGGRET